MEGPRVQGSRVQVSRLEGADGTIIKQTFGVEKNPASCL